MTAFNQSECFISAQHSYIKLKLVFGFGPGLLTVLILSTPQPLLVSIAIVVYILPVTYKSLVIRFHSGPINYI